MRPGYYGKFLGTLRLMAPEYQRRVRASETKAVGQDAGQARIVLAFTLDGQPSMVARS